MRIHGAEWAGLEFENIFGDVTAEDPWEPAMVHELDYGLFRLVGLTAQLLTLRTCASN